MHFTLRTPRGPAVDPTNRLAAAVTAAAAALHLVLAPAAHAGANTGVQAYLSWSATSQVSDIAAAPVNNLYVRLSRTGGLTYLGGEVAISWDPATNFAGTCFAHIGTVYKTSSGATCTYLNRGTATPVVVTDDISQFHVAWTNSTASTGCTYGAIIQIQFETDGCIYGQGCFSLNYAATLDTAGRVDQAGLANSIVTVGGGGSHTCDGYTPAEPTTWGAVKALWHP